MNFKTLLSVFSLFAMTAQTVWALSGTGAKSDPYLITSTADWNTFAENVNSGTTYERKYIQMDADITASTMVGTSTNKFRGFFNGNGHTLTFNLGTSDNRFSEDYAAPFRYVDGATFINLNVAGSIYTSKRYVGGLLSDPDGDCPMTNCRVSVTINSSYEGDGTDGGFVGLNNSNNACLTFTNCLFDGQLLGSNTHSCGGFVGWHKGSVYFNNCLFAPSAAITIGTSNSAIFSRNGVTKIENSYFKTLFGTTQGNNANSMNNSTLLSKLDSGWEIKNDKVVPTAQAEWPPVNEASLSKSGNEWYINMPATGMKILEITEDDINNGKSVFKVYDDGGKNNWYSKNCNGSLIVYVPEDHRIQVSGTALTNGISSDYLIICNGSSTSNRLGNEKYGDTNGSNTTVNVVSTVPCIRFNFKSSELSSYKGLDLTLTILSPESSHDITVKAASNGAMTASPASSVPNETITLSATPDNGYILTDISVKDAGNNNVDVEWTPYTNTATFVMPYTNATVTPTFTTIPAVTVNNPQTGGSVSANPANALPGSTITLTATPSSGYVLSGISVKDANNNTVEVDWAFLSNTATITMPAKPVTVTPIFINSGLSINIPKTGVKTVSIPAAVKSFKVYDNGGADGNYSTWCNGYLALTAPEGYKFRITGTAQTLDIEGSYLTVYDGLYVGSGDAPEYLGNEERWGLRDDPGQDIGTILAKGQTVTLYFSSDFRSTRPGIDLTVTLVDVTTPKSITINQASGGTVTADPSPAYSFSTVTLTAQPQGNKVLSNISVKDANNQNVEVKWNLYDNTATFLMPGTAATVTPTFGKTLSTLSVNMPVTGHKTAAIPSGATSFKVYDDGGADANYSNECRGYLTLIAPVGYRIQLKGTVRSEDTSQGPADYLTVYDGEYNGKGTRPNHLGSKEKWGREASAETIETLTSGGRYMTLYFYSGLADTYSGLNLTANLVEAVEHDVVINQTTGGNLVANHTKAINDQLITLTATTDEDYVFNGVSVKDANNNVVAVTWNNYSNTATFSMPATAATVTPTYLQLTEEFSVNIPTWGCKNVDLPGNVKTIKVYDDGGANGNYTVGCDGSLVLTAPEGYVMEVSGTVTTYNNGAGLSIWDNPTETGNLLVTNFRSQTAGTPRSFKTETSTGRHLRFEFGIGSGGNNYAGLDLTVKLINTLAENNVSVNNVTGGTVVANPTKGKYGDGISLTATPESGYLLNGIRAEDAAHKAVGVNGGAWYSNNRASFSMPGAAVTVYPSFTDDLTANSLSVNIPEHGNSSITIPSGVQSFKVYDHGGSNVYYKPLCNGTLTLNAPAGSKLQMMGTIDAGSIYDYLSVYDGTNTSATPIIENKTSNKENLDIVETDIDVLSSTGNAMTISFRAGSGSVGGNLNLTVTVVDPNASHNITSVTVSNGSIESNVASAKFNETITLTATPANGYALSSLSVMDVNNNAVPITWNMFENTATFVMPGTAVTVTPEFASTNPLVINMPRRNTVYATIPSGVTTLKVYDDGGANGPFSPNTEGTLVLTAPANSIMKVDGKMYARHNFDYFRIYNGDDTNTAAALQVTPEKDDVYEKIGSFVSEGNVMTFYFLAEYNSANRSGLNIDVEIIPTLNLADNVNNTALITENNGKQVNATLTNRTLYKDGNWNTIVLPFNLTISGSSLAGAVVRKMKDATITGSTLNMTFSNPVTTLEAGVPYIIKWSSGSNITNPAFKGVTINATASTVATSSDGNVTFTGTYSPVTNTDGLLFDAHNTDNKAFHAALSAKRDGYTFGGWFTDASLTTPATSIPFGTDGSVTLYTKWVKQLTNTDITVADIAAQTYTGTALTPAVTVKDGSETLTEGIDYTVDYRNNINASSSAKVIISGKGNYNGEVEKMFTINPAEVTLTANSDTKTYNGSNQTVTGFTSSVAGLTFAGVSASGSGKNAGTYDVTFSGVTVNETKDASGNYVVSGLTNGILTINPAAVTLTANSETKTYNGSTQSVTGFTSSVAELTFTGVSASGSGKNADKYDVTFSGVTVNETKDASGNYVVSGLANGKLTINPKALSASFVSNIAAQTYTGTALRPAVTVEDGSTTLTEGTDYTVSYSNNINASSSAKVIISGKGNYNGEVEKMFTINPAAVTLTANSGTKTYTGSNQTVTGFTSSVAGLTFAGVSASGSGTDAGDYDVTFSGVTVNTTKDASGNYVVTGSVNGILTINPAAVTVTADNKEKEYGADDPEFTATVEGLFGNDEITYTLTRVGGNYVGQFTITPDGDEVQGNYVVTYVPGTLTINPATPTAVAENASDVVNIYAYGNTIVVENADSAVFVYDVLGHEISSEPTPSERTEIRVNAGGIYIVKVGKVTKQILVK